MTFSCTSKTGPFAVMITIVFFVLLLYSIEKYSQINEGLKDIDRCDYNNYSIYSAV